MKYPRNHGLAAASLGLCLLFGSCLSQEAREERRAEWQKAVAVQDIDFSALHDGEFAGECVLDLASAKVRARVLGGRVEGIEVLKHTHGPLPRWDGSKVAERVVDAQSLDVEAISGATGSSSVVRKAIEQALLRARPTSP
jgi:uncharacterized protein with FMN-binding domain